MADAATIADQPVNIPHWPTERPLLVLVVLASLAVWVVLALSLIGLAYAVMIGAFFLLAHIAFVAHLRGSGILIGPEQMPGLHERVCGLARQIGLRTPPEAYVIQAGGQLNALATKFLGSTFIVLYSDLLEACGNNTEARDFIIAHELGHLKSGHLRMRWLLIPGLALPFLGTAYSRACEYTCDRFGFAVTSDKNQSLVGLSILAAGAKHGPEVNRRALVAQRRALNTFWMKIGQWLSTHPPIASRLVALEPSLSDGVTLGRGPGLVAGAVVAILFVLPIASAVLFVGTLWPEIKSKLERQQRMVAAMSDPSSAREAAQSDILALVAVAEEHRTSHGTPPESVDELYKAWSVAHDGQPELIDPFDGERYGYDYADGEYVIWSTGPDAEDPDDNIYYSSADAGDD